MQRLNYLWDVDVDSSGDLYIADQNNELKSTQGTE